MEQPALIEAFVLALSDPRVTAALNQTIEVKVESITQPLVTKVEENMSVIKELKNENDKLKKDLCETNQCLDSMEQHARRNNLRMVKNG